MISKDLLFALQTRSKKMIHELDGFTGDIENHSLEEGWTVVTETIKLVSGLPPTTAKYSHIIKAVNRAWLAFCAKSEAAANQLYETIITALEETSWTHPDDAQAAYQLIYAWHDNQPRTPALSVALRRHSHRLLGLIKAIALRSAQPLFAVPVKPHTGLGADAIDMLLCVYSYHTDGEQDDDLRANAADLLLPLVRANPGVGSSIALSLLEHHPERAAILSQLIERYLGAGAHAQEHGMYHWIMLDLLDNSGDSFIYADLDAITTQLAISSSGWTREMRDGFARDAFFYGLENDQDRKLLLTKSKKAMRLAKMIVEGGQSGEHVDALKSLYQSIRPSAPAPAKSKSGRNQFKDLNFKLLVLQELMYVQKTLVPPFDVHQFIRLHTGREIMIEQEGYAVIPEVLAYFESVAIPAPLLAQVQKLAFDGGHEIYHQIFPYWDGECNTFDVKYADDVDLVTNLNRMSSMPSAFVEQYAAALGGKSIAVD
jgi:hypothetical protein